MIEAKSAVVTEINCAVRTAQIIIAALAGVGVADARFLSAMLELVPLPKVDDDEASLTSVLVEVIVIV